MKKKVTFKDYDDSDDSGSEIEVPTPVIRHKRTPPPTPPVITTPRDDPDIEDLIKQLEQMQVDDPAYAVIYFRAVNRNPLVRDCVAPPADRRSRATTPTRSFARDLPPHMSGGPGMGFRPEGRKCFGCGAFGHGMMT